MLMSRLVDSGWAMSVVHPITDNLLQCGECPLCAKSGHSLGQLARPLSARSSRRRQVCVGSVANLCPPRIGDATMTMLICVAYQMPPSVRSPSPNLVGQLGHQTQLRPLFVFGQHIAFLGRGETALQ